MSIYSRAVKLFLLTAFLLCLNACGFHLRGSYNLPDEIQIISVTSADPYSALSREMKRRLQLYHIDVAAPEVGIANLHLTNESYGESTLSLYQNAKVAQRQFTYTVSYAVTIPEKGQYNFSTALSRTYLDNPLTALAKSVEEDMLAQEMRIEATKQIMRQLARLTAHIESFDLAQTIEEKLIETEEYQSEQQKIQIKHQFKGKVPEEQSLKRFIKSNS